MDNKSEKQNFIDEKNLTNIQDNFPDVINLKEKRNISNFDFSSETEDIAICYISDLHLDFKENLDIFSIIKKLKNSLPDFERSNFNYNGTHIKVVFIGDISFKFSTFKNFFLEYRKQIPYYDTYVILGNHELWDHELKKGSFDDLVNEYRKFLRDLKCPITLLENELLFPNTKEIFDYKEIMLLKKEEINNLFLKNPFAIFGGIGFSGLNKEYNAEKKPLMYNYFLNRQLEIELSNKTNLIHKKLIEVANDKKIYFITHMPKEDWSCDKYEKGWIYLSGHTHKNYYCENEERHVYSDNQVGYKTNSFGFKFLREFSQYDIFKDYKDGIYEINGQQYKEFYYGIGIRIDFNREYEKLYMLKNNSIYCFFIKLKNQKDLKLLNGGQIQNVENNDLNYYFENMINYTKSVNIYLKSYNEFLENVSKEIKSFGGDGRIHGCIIDIDFFNHIFINPLDGSIVPYFANSMSDKYVYKNIQSLLKYKSNKLYINFKNKHQTNTSLICDNSNQLETKECKHVVDTSIYKISGIIYKLQYTTKYNIIRKWSENLLNSNSKENGKEIINTLLSFKEK